MKKLTVSLFILWAALCNAQPRLVGALTYWGQKQGGAVFRIDLPSTTAPGIIYSFDNTAPHSPRGGVCAGDGDWLYGVMGAGGAHKNGVFYRIRQNGTGFTNLYDLTSSSTTIPYYHLDGMIYFSESNNIKKYDPSSGTITDLTTVNTPLVRNLCIDADDWIYFTEGYFNSTLVKMRTNGADWTSLHIFNDPVEGSNGKAGITEAPGDSLFGVQTNGGPGDAGTLYSIRKDGTGFFIHHYFTAATGIYPESKLAYFDGKLYGTTSHGGDFDHGVIFCINADGTNYRVIHHLTNPAAYNARSFGNISISSNGRIFGSFADFFYSSSGSYYRLFKLDTSGANFEPFFTGNSTNIQRENGGFNQDICMLDDESMVFTTYEYGHYDGGVLNFSDTSGTGNDIYHFGYSPTGFRPTHGLMKASNGKLYGTVSIGGTGGGGLIYSMNDNGTGYTIVHAFEDSEGYEPSGTLLEASDGKLYGACRTGGPLNTGCIYRIDKNGTNFQVLYDFSDFSGYSPVGSLVEDNAGFLYGATFYSGGNGALFRINKDGTNFMSLRVFMPGDLGYPYNGVRISGNYLYGSCGYGGALNKGGVFRIKTDGSSYQVLHEFTGGSDGELPVATPFIANNGKLYGSTVFGGDNGDGTLYSIDSTGGNYTILHQFLYSADGSAPWGGVIQASDGLIYGGTSYSGVTGGSGGTVYKINPDGSDFSLVRAFEFDTEGSNTTTLLDLNSSFILPVEWLLFNGERKDQTVLLSWKTAQEQNNDRFEVERSADGTAFSKIGSVTAAGNTNTITAYTFTDTRPFSGMNHYRLKQMDLDGNYSYSSIVSVNMPGRKNTTIGPNPVTTQLNIRIPQGSDYTTIDIIDAAGKLVFQKNIARSITFIQLDVNHLPAGWYMLRLIGKVTEQQTFLKQ